ncbi:putative carboxylesterase Culp3 [Paramyrothecium foliicola]|nr:putative carboxylesterase Culp3 [Paramyrothecium foliicola]
MPSPKSILRAAVVAGVASAASVELQPRQMVTETCAEVHMFLSRGNNEPYPGRQGALVTAVCKGLESCDYEDIQMQNALSDEYCGAVSEGTANGVNQIIAYNKRCPNSKLVVTGFSQGAHVVGDIFGGGGGSFFQGCQTKATPNLPFNTPAGQAVAAIVTFGDVRHAANQPYNYLGGATHWGLFPRNSQQLANAATFAGVWRDYCNAGDPICAGGDVTEEHLNYFQVYTPEVAEYIHQKLAAASAGSNTHVPVAPTKSAASVVTTAAPFPSAPHGGNATAPSQTVITVTDTAGATVTVVTTVCPATFSYVSNPTAETKPPHLSVTQKYPLPEASVPTTINLSSIPVTATGTIPAANATIPQPTATHSVPVTGGTGSNLVKMGGVLGMAIAAAAALF